MKKKLNNKLIERELKLKSKKQREQWCTLLVRRERKRNKNQATINDNLTIVSCPHRSKWKKTGRRI